MTFKKLVKLISQIKTEEDLNEALAQIEKSYWLEKITWDDHETLHIIAANMRKA